MHASYLTCGLSLPSRLLPTLRLPLLTAHALPRESAHRRRSVEAPNGIWEFMRGMIVIHLHHLPIPLDNVSMTMAFIEVFIRNFCAIFAIIPIDAIAIESIANQGRMSAGGGVFNAIA